MARIPIFPIDAVVYPGQRMPLHVFEERYCLMVEDCLSDDRPIGLVLARPDEPQDKVEREPEAVGTALRIVSHRQLKDGRFLLDTHAGTRFRIERVARDRMYQEADVAWLDEPVGDEATASAVEARVRRDFARLGAEALLVGAEGPVATSYAVAAALEAPLGIRQRLLAAPTALARLVEEAVLLGRAVPAARGAG